MCKLTDVQKERKRVLAIIESHKSWLPDIYPRLYNLINSGFDFEEEMKLPVEERVMGFHWPDDDDG